MSNYPVNPGPLSVADLKNKSDGSSGHLCKGDRREELVEHLQKMLKALGFDLGAFGPNRDGVDGKFGNGIERAVNEFQEKNKDWEGNQLSSNGSVDERTADAFNRALVGAWYDFYQTDIELTEGKRIITAERKFLSDKGLDIENLENEKNVVIIIKGLTRQKNKEDISPEVMTMPYSAEIEKPATVTLNNELVNFIDDLKKDTTYGSMIKITSTVRDAKIEARAVLNNQKSDSNYYKIFSANWRTAILAAIKDRNLKVNTDFDSAMSNLAEWISEDPNRSPHASGRAVDFGLAGGKEDFKRFIETESKKRSFKFIDETKYHYYHVQM
jgi:peptidoglycan hydrolase-like protein with peptidoglycan-binding domain